MKLCGAHLNPVLDTLAWLKAETKSGRDHQAPHSGKTTARKIYCSCRWVLKDVGPEVPVHFTAFHPDHKMTEHTSRARGDGCRARAVSQ